MATITIQVGDEMLRRGQAYARVRGTTLEQVVEELLTDALSTGAPRPWTQEIWDLADSLGGRQSLPRMTRDELHERTH